MALKATVYKAELQISDMDRHYYESHSLTLAQHPSETDERLMLRLLAFSLFAHEHLTFTRGISSADEPDLWQKSLSGDIEHWIELGQPDVKRLAKACGKADRVQVVTYGARSAEMWWEKALKDLARFTHLNVLFIPSESTRALAGLIKRNMDLQCLIEDRQVWISAGSESIEINPVYWLESP